jgi:hypothetical protein
MILLLDWLSVIEIRDLQLSVEVLHGPPALTVSAFTYLFAFKARTYILPVCHSRPALRPSRVRQDQHNPLCARAKRDY